MKIFLVQLSDVEMYPQCFMIKQVKVVFFCNIFSIAETGQVNCNWNKGTRSVVVGSCAIISY